MNDPPICSGPWRSIKNAMRGHAVDPKLLSCVKALGLTDRLKKHKRERRFTQFTPSGLKGLVFVAAPAKRVTVLPPSHFNARATANVAATIGASDGVDAAFWYEVFSQG